jgi:hypothetical protein
MSEQVVKTKKDYRAIISLILKNDKKEEEEKVCQYV